MRRRSSNIVRGLGEGQLAASGTLACIGMTTEYPVKISTPKGLDPASLRLAGSVTPRADAVKDGRRSERAAGRGIGRPRLDGGEHGVTLRVVGPVTISTPCVV
jgi:hypothetical protein